MPSTFLLIIILLVFFVLFSQYCCFTRYCCYIIGLKAGCEVKKEGQIALNKVLVGAVQESMCDRLTTFKSEE